MCIMSLESRHDDDLCSGRGGWSERVHREKSPQDIPASTTIRDQPTKTRDGAVLHINRYLIFFHPELTGPQLVLTPLPAVNPPATIYMGKDKVESALKSPGQG